MEGEEWEEEWASLLAPLLQTVCAAAATLGPWGALATQVAAFVVQCTLRCTLLMGVQEDMEEEDMEEEDLGEGEGQVMLWLLA